MNEQELSFIRIVAGVMDFQTVSALCMKIIRRYH